MTPTNIGIAVIVIAIVYILYRWITGSNKNSIAAIEDQIFNATSTADIDKITGDIYRYKSERSWFKNLFYAKEIQNAQILLDARVRYLERHPQLKTENTNEPVNDTAPTPAEPQPLVSEA